MANDAVPLSELDSLDESRAWSFFESARDGLDSFTLSISTLVDETSDRLVDAFLPETTSSSSSGGGGGATYDDARSEDSDDRDGAKQPPRGEHSLGGAESALRELLGRHTQSLKQRGERLSRLEETVTRAGDHSREIRENSARLRRLAEQERLQDASDGDSCCALL